MSINIRNLAIIAHVDHGKTTLVDGLFKQSGIFRENQTVADCAMDSNELERERGITILAKCTSFIWKDYKLNIVDTPGHADFGGEVERILSMVDGVVVLVDASEGPMPQTKFVLTKALALNLNPIVVINKIDRQDARIDEVIDECFELFIALGANEKQLDFPILYASGRNGWAVHNMSDEKLDLSPLLETIVTHIPPPTTEEKPFQMLITIIEYDQYLGRILTGKVLSGHARINDFVHSLRIGVGELERAKLTKLLAFEGLKRIPIESASAGDIIAIAGLAEATVADTIAAMEISEPIDSIPIDPPTISITLSVNDSPLAGKDGGKKLTSRMIGDRLFREAEGNVSISVKRSETDESYEVSGRGELQLGILIEIMRREGFELSISRPRVLFKKDEQTNEILEPIEELFIDLDDEFTGIVVEKIIKRKGEMQEMKPSGAGKTRIKFLIPTRGLIGYYGEFLTDTRGTGVMNKSFYAYQPHKGEIEGRQRGVLVSTSNGKAIPYALFFLKERGTLFITSGNVVYEGMIIGEHTRENELEVNPTKEKQLSNCRSTGKEDHIIVPNPRLMTLEQAIAYIQDDERVEVTPKSIRLRKKYLDSNIRKKMSRVSKK